MLLSKFLDPKNDFAFKRIFGTEKNKGILIHFLNDMLDSFQRDKIQSISFLKTIQDPDIAAKKQSIVDVLCTDEKGQQYIVEMQVARTTGFEKRAQYYAAKAYVTQMNEGEAYYNLKEIIFLAITDFIMFPDKPEYKSDHVILDKQSFARDLKDFSFCFLELPKFNKTIDEITTIVEKWAYFFKHAADTAEANVEQITGTDAVIRQAYEALNQFSWSAEELHSYEQEKKRELDAQAILEYRENVGVEKGRAQGLEEGLAKGIEEGLAKGIEEGLAKGIEKGKSEGESLMLLRIVKKSLSRGSNMQDIIDITGLTEPEILSMMATLAKTDLETITQLQLN